MIKFDDWQDPGQVPYPNPTSGNHQWNNYFAKAIHYNAARHKEDILRIEQLEQKVQFLLDHLHLDPIDAAPPIHRPGPEKPDQ